MYLREIASSIRLHLEMKSIPEEHADDLLLLYALLLRVKGNRVTCSDIHDAWSIWMWKQNQDHESLVPFEQLPRSVQREDSRYQKAVVQAGEACGIAITHSSAFYTTLFPDGPPTTTDEIEQAYRQYKIMVESSESLVSRRQSVNTFFLTMNGALLTASGLIVQSSGDKKLTAIGMLVLTVSGAILCGAWKSLIKSFGQLNKGKFKVINTIEKFLKASIYAAEWEALDRGENSKTYKSFTSREIWVPIALLWVYILAAFTSAVFILKLTGIV